MNKTVKQWLVAFAVMIEVLEFAGSREGLSMMLVGVIDTFWIQTSGVSAIAILGMTLIPTLTLCWWSEHQYS